MNKRVFCKVKCDYFCEEENRWYIDAWINNSDDDRNSRTVGYVDGVSGNIYYKTEDAENDPFVREVATAKQAEVRAEKKKVWVVSIVEYKADENYLDSYTRLYTDEQQAKARVYEYY